MIVRSLYWSHYSSQWFRQISRSPVLSELIKQEKGLAEKLHRHYLRMDYPIEKRFRLLSEHYHLAERLIAPKVLQQALLQGGLLVSRLTINPENDFELVFGYGRFGSKEGELALYLRQCGHSTDLARVTFTLISKAGSPSVYIGGLQGSNEPNARERVGQASKACSGLSPKRIVMEALFAIAEQLGLRAILGVPDEQHISSKKETKYFNYNTYWLEFKALCTQEGDYSLPLVPVHKAIKEVPTKRRAKYRQQHALLEAIHKDTRNCFATKTTNG